MRWQRAARGISALRLLAEFGLLAALSLLAGLPSAAAVRAAEKIEIEYKPDVIYATVAGEDLKLDLATPKALDRPAPAIVVIHGGGWEQGRRQDMAALAKQFAERGYVAPTISYRLTPKHRFPAQIEDVKCAVRYLRAHADELKIDPQRIGAMGTSAGGHLAMMLGVLDTADGMEGAGGNPEQSSKVQAVVNVVGPINLVLDKYDAAQQAVLSAFVGGDPREKQDECRRASPITYVNRGDAPTLCFYGTKDPLVPFDQAFQITTALTNAGVPARVELLVGASHGWGGKEMTRTMEATIAFFDQYLKP